MTRYEVVCPDGLVRHEPYVAETSAAEHAELAAFPPRFARRRCRLGPIAGALERSLPPCSGGAHTVRAVELPEHDLDPDMPSETEPA